MEGPIPYADLLVQLRCAEELLLKRHLVRLCVHKITSDGCNALCVAGQVRSRFLRRDLGPVEVVDVCHTALSTLHRVGLRPLVATVRREALAGLQPPDPGNPFMLRTALHAAGLGAIMGFTVDIH